MKQIEKIIKNIKKTPISFILAFLFFSLTFGILYSLRLDSERFFLAFFTISIFFILSFLIPFLLYLERLISMKDSLNISLEQKNKEIEELKNQDKKKSEEAVQRSKIINRGISIENLIPFLIEEFDYSNFQYLGRTIDYIYYENLDNPDLPTSIYFLEVKTGKSRLTPNQRKVKDAIKQGRVYFATFNPDKSGLKIEKNETVKL